MLLALTACTKTGPAPERIRDAEPRPRTAAFDTHWQTESQFIVESTVIDLAGMAYFAKYNRALESGKLLVNAVERPATENAPLTYKLSVHYPSAFDIETELSVTGSIWAPELYREVTKRFLEKLSVDLSKTLPDDGAVHSNCLRDLTGPTAPMIERVNNTVSGELQAHFLSADRHEQAALLLAAFALREHSGMFYEIRSELCRMTAHLAFAFALRSEPPTTIEGQLAGVALAALYHDQRSALRLLAALTTQDRSAEAWARALKIRRLPDTGRSQRSHLVGAP